jgi:lycopene beta-cyclase
MARELIMQRRAEPAIECHTQIRFTPWRFMMCPQASDVDLVIIGGGCAGLSLGACLAQYPNLSRRTIILEPRKEYRNDRTWSFFASDIELKSDPRVTATWPAWSFSRSGKEVVRAVPGTSYASISSERFYASAQACINQSGHVELRNGVTVKTLQQQAEFVLIDTDHGLMKARYVVDTRPPPRESARSALIQVFLGVEIETHEPVFTTGIAQLMHDMSCDSFGFRFLYLLPSSPTRALVEETRFTPRPIPEDVLERGLFHALQDQTAGTPYQELRRERGHLPMGLLIPRVSPGSRIMMAGIGGGALRPASGYGFRRIEAWAKATAAMFAAGQPPMGHPPEPVIRATMDRMFLEVISKRPSLAPECFMSLAKKADPLSLIDFLSDRGGITNDAKIARALPARHFLSHFLRKARSAPGIRVAFRRKRARHSPRSEA